MITVSALVALGVKPSRAKKYVGKLNLCMLLHDIDTEIRTSHFIAQLLHESGKLRYTRENMNYSESALLTVFSKYFNADRARQYARNPKKIGNRVYADRMGNGNETSGDGYRYRGRGLIQLTGKNNYRDFSEWVGDSKILANPDLVSDEYAVESATFYWDVNRLNRIADKNDVKLLTRAINGGTNGLKDRRVLTKKLLLDFGL